MCKRTGIVIDDTAFGIGTGGIGFLVVGVIAAGAGLAGGYYGGKGGEKLADLFNE